MHHLERPIVREPDAYRVLARLAEAAGYTTRPSSVAGFYHGMIDLWGGPEKTATDLRDTLVSTTLMAFVDPSRGVGVRPGNSDRLALRIQDVRKAGDFALTVQDAIDLIEGWVARGIVRRGLCLKCARCRHADFYPVEEVGQTFLCHRCQNDEQVGTAWPLATSGPPWYFRLDEVVVQALKHHAEVPILAVERPAGRRAGRGSDRGLLLR